MGLWLTSHDPPGEPKPAVAYDGGQAATRVAAQLSDEDSAELDRAIGADGPLFQPLVWMGDLSIAGYESLARGPTDSPLAQPVALFAAARVAGRVAELDDLMTRRSITALAGVHWHPSLTLFANLDPDTMKSPPSAATIAVLMNTPADGRRVVVEITERSLLADPGALIRSIEVVRSHGWGIAMDDVGVEEDSLTLLAILRPDVVKLDMSILHRRFDAHAARVSATTRLYCDRTGALMVCEGVETEAHEARARALGADLVQGFRYGAAAPLPGVTGPAVPPVRLLGRGAGEERGLADRLGAVRHAILPRVQIVAMAAELVGIGAGHTTAAVVIATAPSIGDVPADYLAALAAAVPHSALVALVAPGCGPRPTLGVRGVDASMERPLGSPWSISVIGPTMAVSILAEWSDADPREPTCHRIVHDRATVAQIFRLLLSQVTS